MVDSTSRCPYCAENIMAAAVKCRFCGEYLDEDLRLERLNEGRIRTDFNPGLAAVLSIIGTGLGQLYQMRVVAAISFMAAMGFFILLSVTVKSMFLWAAAVIHITNIWEAYLWRPEPVVLGSAEEGEGEPVLITD